MHKVSAYIIAYNEAAKIEAAINSVLWADEIVLVDSYSTDNTVEIAESLGARVVQVPFTGFGDLRNRAMAACTHEWIFSLDSDERCTPAARAEILACLRLPEAEDYYIPRRNFFMGRWIKFSGYYPDYRQPQLFKKGALVFKDGDPVHEDFRIVSQKPVAYLKHPIWQIPFAQLSEAVHKMNRYSTLGAEKLEKNGEKASMWKAMSHAIWAFLHMYILKLGILDGWPGFIIAFSSFEVTLYKYAKSIERQAKWLPPPSPPLRREAE